MLAALDVGIRSGESEPTVPAEDVRKKSRLGLPGNVCCASESRPLRDRAFPCAEESDRIRCIGLMSYNKQESEGKNRVFGNLVTPSAESLHTTRSPRPIP
jgi:hypothetical protein